MRWPLLVTGIILCLSGGVFALIENAKRTGHDINERLNKDEPITNEALMAQIGRQNVLSGWGWQDAESLKMTALAEYTLSRRSEDAAADHLLSEALRHLAQGLAFAPADPGNWLRLATMRALNGAPAGDISRALAMSARTGPALSHLIAPRLGLALTVWDDMEIGEQNIFRDQIAMLQRQNPQAAAKLAAASERNQHLFQSVSKEQTPL